jgi:hypothetical protein
MEWFETAVVVGAVIGSVDGEDGMVIMAETTTQVLLVRMRCWWWGDGMCLGSTGVGTVGIVLLESTRGLRGFQLQHDSNAIVQQERPGGTAVVLHAFLPSKLLAVKARAG